MTRKSVSPVVATALLLVVAVTAVVAFQGWFQTFSSDMLVRSEQQTDSVSGSGIVDVTGNTLYYENDIEQGNLSIKSVQVAGEDCAINRNLSSGIRSLSLSDCLDNVSGSTEVTVVTDEGVQSEEIYVPEEGSDGKNNAPGTSYFITEWRTNFSGASDNNSISLPLRSGGTYDFTVDWGDGNTSSVTSWDDPDKNHTYSSKGVYNISINGTFEGFGFGGGREYVDSAYVYYDDAPKLIAIHQWGPAKLSGGGKQLYFTQNLERIGSPDISHIQNMSMMFEESTFNGSLASWDVSGVTDMSRMFQSASFDSDISSWDVSSVTNMSALFRYSSFTGNISEWDTSSVTDMSFMFESTDFNDSISDWDTSSVTDMSGMFTWSPFDRNISGWNTSSVRDMGDMFDSAFSFNQSLNSWDTSSVTNMSSMFEWARSFDRDLSGWNTSQVEDMYVMFHMADSFTQDISSWCVEKIGSKPYLFDDDAAFEGQSAKQPDWGDTC